MTGSVPAQMSWGQDATELRNAQQSVVSWKPLLAGSGLRGDGVEDLLDRESMAFR